MICTTRLSLGLFGMALLAIPGHPASQLTNISVRAGSGADASTLIVGFTIAGSGSKSMLVRGIGPTLSVFNVPSPLADPELRLFAQGGAEVASNDNWGGSPAIAGAAAAVGGFALPSGSLDAAVLAPLPVGSYSAHLTARSGTGVALVEAYDTDGALSSAQISNLSARCLAGTGGNVLTVGFAISGDTALTVLIRAVGPSLAAFGVNGTLANPQLRLFSGRGSVIGSNDDWLAAAGWSAAFSAVGAFPLATNTRDATLLVSLAPGSYTAQTSGADNASGVALIEVYAVPNPPASSLVLRPVDNSAQGTPPGSISGGVGQGGTLPAVLTQARPVYPFDLRAAGIVGEALIDFIVDVDGRVVNAFVLRATDARFGESALAAVRQWIFRPGRNAAGRAVPTLMQVPIVYTLNS
jgi:TonB family protein